MGEHVRNETNLALRTPIALGLVIFAALALMACGKKAETTKPPDKKPETTAKPTTAAKPDNSAAELEKQKMAAKLEEARRNQARGDGERSGYRTAGLAQDVALAMGNLPRKARAPVGNAPPRSKAVAWDNSGKINSRALSGVFSRRRGALQSCYERGLKRNPSLKGRVKLMVNIRSDGRVNAVRVQQSTLGDRQVTGCMTSKVKGWLFPKPDGGGVTVAKTFTFTPQT